MNNKAQTTTCTIDLIIQEIEHYAIYDAENDCIVGYLDDPVLRVSGRIDWHGESSIIGPIIIKNRDDIEEAIAQSLRALNEVRSKGHPPSKVEAAQ